MVLHTFYIGHNVDGVLTWHPSQVETAAAELLANVGIDGFTAVTAAGYWKSEAEPSTVVTVVGLTDDNARLVAACLAARLCQEAVLLTSTPLGLYALVAP